MLKIKKRFLTHPYLYGFLSILICVLAYMNLKNLVIETFSLQIPEKISNTQIPKRDLIHLRYSPDKTYKVMIPDYPSWLSPISPAESEVPKRDPLKPVYIIENTKTKEIHELPFILHKFSLPSTFGDKFFAYIVENNITLSSSSKKYNF